MTSNEDKKHYVYKHQLDGELFYIGSGNKARTSRLWIYDRNSLWSKFVGDRIDDVVVTIICEVERKSTALKIEETLIFELDPECNLEFTDPEKRPNHYLVNKPRRDKSKNRTQFKRHWKSLSASEKKDLSKNSGLANTYISTIANGGGNPTLSTLIKIIDADSEIEDITWFVEPDSEVQK